MRYYVFGIDDRMYGPEDIAVIESWAKEGRVGSDTRLRNADTGEEITYGQLVGAFRAPPVFATPNMTAQTDLAASAERAANGYFVWALIDSLGGIILVYFLHGFGLIFAGYGVYNGYMAYKSGHKYGLPVFILGIVSVVAVLVGWGLRIVKVI